MSVEVHSRTAIIKGHPELGIPQGSTVLVSELPTRQFVRKFFKTEEPEISLSLDPGKYEYTVRFHDPEGPGGMRFQEAFYIECDESTYKALAFARPQFAKVRQTTRGMRYICGFAGCRKTTTTRVAMVEHEASHQGMSVLKDPKLKEKAKHAVLQAGQSEKKKAQEP